MTNEGMPLPALANLLGHSDVKMTMRYYNMNKKTIDKARNILNRLGSILNDDPREALINSLMTHWMQPVFSSQSPRHRANSMSA